MTGNKQKKTDYKGHFDENIYMYFDDDDDNANAITI